MEHDDPFANEKAVERSTDAGATSWPKLEQAFAKGP
jgi:hypothetical protein